MIWLNAKTRSVLQFIGALERNSETVDPEIESLVPLAQCRWVDPSDTLVLAT